jgi:hypothetical protein
MLCKLAVIVGQLSRKNEQEIETKILKLIFIVFDLLRVNQPRSKTGQQQIKIG